MKQVLFFAFAAIFMASCDDAAPTGGSTTSSVTTDSNGTVTKTTTTVYKPSEGDVMMKDGKTMKWENGKWVATTGNTTLSNGIVISNDGIVMQDTKTVHMNEGETVTATGNFFDRAGTVIDNAWDETKRGVGKAAYATKEALENTGKIIKKGAQKVGNKTDSVVKDIKN